MKNLVQRLESAGLNIAALGEGIIVSEFGGRILALAPDSETNLLWINPATFRNAQIEAWRTGHDWPNLGGDRAWISPEVDTNLHHSEKFAATGNPPTAQELGAAYQVPRQIDPANYILTRDTEQIRLAAQIEAPWLRSGSAVALQIERVVTLLVEPPAALPADVSFAGYMLVSRLSATKPLQAARPAIWNLLQVPGGGTITATSSHAATPTSWIGNPRWTGSSTSVTSEIQTGASFKWSLRASQSRGRLLNLRALDRDRAGLLVREFPVAAESVYADCPPHAPHETGHVCQVYVDDGALGGFGEMEFHCPALQPGSTQDVCTVVKSWGFIGPKKEIQTLHDVFIH